ncbi:hypothetical protein P9112_005211 [Eukaryota sp. TZLM1-RC]
MTKVTDKQIVLFYFTKLDSKDISPPTDLPEYSTERTPYKCIKCDDHIQWISSKHGYSNAASHVLAHHSPIDESLTSTRSKGPIDRFLFQLLERSKTCLDGSNSSSTVNDLSLLSTTRPFNTTSLFPQFQNLPSESILDFCTMRLLRLFQHKFLTSLDSCWMDGLKEALEYLE